MQTPAAEMHLATLEAIWAATEFDDRHLNSNFDYDNNAYTTVRVNLKRLVELREYDEAMELSLESRQRAGRDERRGVDD